MNSWAETIINVNNNEPHNGLRYAVDFVFYFPQEFAECAMFQLVELKDPESSRDEEDITARLAEAKRASRIYKIDPDAQKLAEVTKTDGTETVKGVEIENDYAELINSGAELTIDDTSSVVLQPEEHEFNVKSTFATYYKDNNAVERFLTPVSVTAKKNMRFYRITVNISAQDQGVYVLDGGKSKSFILRLVLRRARNQEVFTSEKFDYDLLWNTTKDESGNITYVSPKGLPEIDKDFVCRWAMNEKNEYIIENGKPVLQIAEKTEQNYHSVTLPICLGLSSPTKISAVFTQVEQKSANA